MGDATHEVVRRWAPAVVWTVAALGLPVGLVVAAATGHTWIFVVVIAAVLVTGIRLATGPYQRSGPGPRGRGHGPVGGAATPRLRLALEARLDRLDRIEHRRLDLGGPWPSVVVGPTGVAVIAPASVAHGPVVRRLEAVVAEVQQRLDDSPAQVLPVRGLLVLERADTDVIDLGDGPVRRVEVRDLLERMGQGQLAPMSAVDAAYARLAGELAPDLSAAS